MKKIALVTGAASGIGLACAERLAKEGCEVVLADVNETAGGEHASRLGGSFFRSDLGTRAGCKALVDEVLKKHGTVHILVNNAGYQHVAPIEEFPEEQWERMLALMLTAPFLLTRYCWPAMKKQRWGRIVNIGSIHALVASPYKAAYISAKHGLVGLTKTAALEGGEFGITANAICPAYVRTPLVAGQIADQAVLGGDVAHLEGRGDERVDRGDVHHAAPFLLLHRRPAVAREEERRGEHEGEHLLPPFLGKFLDRRDVLEARVVDEHVHGAVFLQCLLDEALAAFPLA